MVVGLDAVTPTGGALRTGGAPRAAVGPDLSQVLIGSEGTLAVVTDARLRLHPTPATEKRAAYGLASFADGLDVCRRIVRRGATPACLRLYDAREAQRSYEHDANVLLVLDEGDPAIVDAMLAVARSEAEATPGAERLDDGLVDRWREHRNDVSALEKVVQAGIVVDTIEVAASWAALPGLYERVCESLLRIEGALVASAHCSHSYTDGGCLYFTFAGRAGGDPAAKDAYYRASFDAAMNATIAAGGAISHHHGIGLNRARFVRSSLGAAAFELLAGLKRHLDPNGILNPGKLGLPSPFLPEGWAWT
jgi:alkyldihydroxyacetonephosphate synthase